MGYEYTVNNIKQAIYDLMKETKLCTKDIEGIGFGFPGQVDYKSGIVRLAPNIPGWVEVPIAKLIEDEFKIPFRVDNDVRCAALGELNDGAGQGCENLICITVGTGIGSGLIVNGKLVRGASNAAGEIGHIKMQIHDGPICGCGDTGCLEAFASGPSIVAMAEDYIKGGKSTKYREMANGNPITPYIVCEAAKAGDPVAQRIFTIMGEYIGVGLASVVNLLNPEKIIVGGGVADASGGVHHVIHQEGFLTLYLPDDVHDLALVGALAAFVHDGQIHVQLGGEGPGAADAAHVGGYDDNILGVFKLVAVVLNENRVAQQIVHGDVEKALDLVSVKIHCQNAVDSGCLKHIGNHFRADGNTSGARSAVLTCITVVRNNSSDSGSRSSSESVNHNDKFHQIVIGGNTSRLNDKYVSAADILIQFYLNFAV